MSNVPPSRARTDPPAVQPPTSSSAAPAPRLSSDHHRFHLPTHRRRPTTSNSNNNNSNALNINTTSGDRERDKSSHQSYYQQAKETVQSAIELKPPISFEHLLRRSGEKGTGSTNDLSGSGSGRANGVTTSPLANVAGVGPGGSATAETETGTRAPLLPDQQHITKQRAGPKDVAKAKRANAARAAELRRSLAQAQEMGMQRTRQLDDTYYAILEKATVLHSTVSGLNNLLKEVGGVHERFDEATSQLEKETSEGIESFGGFEAQDKRVGELLAALEKERKETEGLNSRLENARVRVEAYERREDFKRHQRRLRGYVGGCVILAIGALVLAVLLARNKRAVGQRLDTVGHRLAAVGDVVEDAAAVLGAKVRAPRPSPSEDPYLRKLFDGL